MTREAMQATAKPTRWTLVPIALGLLFPLGLVAWGLTHHVAPMSQRASYYNVDGALVLLAFMSSIVAGIAWCVTWKHGFRVDGGRLPWVIAGGAASAWAIPIGIVAVPGSTNTAVGPLVALVTLAVALAVVLVATHRWGRPRAVLMGLVGGWSGVCAAELVAVALWAFHPPLYPGDCIGGMDCIGDSGVTGTVWLSFFIVVPVTAVIAAIQSAIVAPSTELREVGRAWREGD